MRRSRKFHRGGGGGVVFIYVINVFHRGPYASLRVQLFLEGQLDPRGVGGVWDPIASRRGSVPDFLRKPITTCDFQVEWGGGGPDPLFPNSGSAHRWVRPMQRLGTQSKGATIRYRYNQVPHLTQDTNGKVTNSQLDTTNESQEISPFPAGDHNGSALAQW